MDARAKGRVVFDFPGPRHDRLSQARARKAPRESLLCFLELERRGWQIGVSDDRWRGIGGRVRRVLARFTEIPSVDMVRLWWGADIVVVVTRFSLVLGLIAKALRKRLVFVDVTYHVPTRPWARLFVRACLSIADSVAVYTRHQRDLWSQSFGDPAGKIVHVTYGLDEAFYEPVASGEATEEVPYIIAVGRDPERDLGTVVAVAHELGLRAKLVTLPYLVPQQVRDDSTVDILEKIEYAELFHLYGTAAASIVPIKADVEYAAGIRAVMEGMLLGVPMVVTRTPCLEELFEHNREVVFVEPGNTAAAVRAVLRLQEDAPFRERLVANARRRMLESHSLSCYADSLDRFLGSLA